MVEPGLIICGMYAFSDRLRGAWGEVFANFEFEDRSLGPVAIELDFGLLDSRPRATFLCGQTCGYPLLKTHSGEYSAFCVPVFDVEGADGKLYSSRIIVPAGSGMKSLRDCAGAVVAINGRDSNSGMNLLRYELARAGAAPGFFREVRITGGHLESLEAVAAGDAQLAAIDCVSFQLIADEYPQLAAAVDSIGFTARCCGLPFVLARAQATPEKRARLLEGLQKALERTSNKARALLHLRAFDGVEDSEYESILELENFAISKGYAEIN